MVIHRKFAAFLTIVTFSLLSVQAFAVSDTDLTNIVKTNISNNATTSQSKISVTAKKGIVYLRGDVKTEAEASAAIQIASAVDGVKDVNTDRLKVRDSTQPYKDTYITAKVKGAFMREKIFGDSPIDVSGISIETKNGIVYLTGTADKQSQLSTAIAVAKTISGVRDVQSTVTIKQAN